MTNHKNRHFRSTREEIYIDSKIKRKNSLGIILGILCIISSLLETDKESKTEEEVRIMYIALDSITF